MQQKMFFAKIPLRTYRQRAEHLPSKIKILTILTSITTRTTRWATKTIKTFL